MRWGRIIALWALAAALGVLHYEGEEAATEPTPHEEEVATRARLLRAAAGDVQAVRLVRGTAEVQIVRAGETWSVLTPPGASIPQGLIDAFVAAITSVEVIDTMAEEGDAGFGLAERQERIEIEEAGQPPVVLQIGDATPTGTAAYVREPSGPIRVIGRNPLDYRDLILDAARPAAESDPGSPVARRPLTISVWAG